MDRRRLFTLGFQLAVLALAGGASPAAAVTIGQLAPGTPPLATCNTEPFDLLQPTVTSGNPYVVPSMPPATVLEIRSWSTNAAAVAGQKYTMKVFRKVAEPTTYMVVGHDGPRDLTSAAVNTFSTSIPVKPGDVLGMNDNDGSAVDNACDFTVPGGDSFLFLGGNLADGQADTFTPETEAQVYRLNVTAEVDPSNSFTVGAISRNKKKGTATITVGVPNEGELAASGKGVTATLMGPPNRLLIRAIGKKKRKLNETGKVKVNFAVTYTPTGGRPNSQSVKVKLIKR